MLQMENLDIATPSTMNILLDFRSRQPIYLQIVEQVRELLARGELKQGAQLPTVRQLATALGINFNTVARAYRLLDDTGLISTQQGRGTYIWDAPTAETVSHLRQQSLEGLTLDYLAEVARLSYTPDQIARTIVRYLQEWKEHGEAPNQDLEERG